MSLKLFFNAFAKFLCGVLLMVGLIFLPAGTWGYSNGWLLMGLLFVPMLIVGIVLFLSKPELLKKRLTSKETRKEQGLVVKLSGLMFLIGFILSGLGIRLGWFVLPISVSVVASVIFLLGYGMYAEVLRENAYLSRTIEVQEGQKVVDTGLYGVVRHPMYAATILMFLTMPLILGSVYALVVFFAYPLLMVLRIQGEETLLEKELDGYRDYKQRVKYRLIPYIW